MYAFTYDHVLLHTQQFRANIGFMQPCFRCNAGLVASAACLLPERSGALKAVCRCCWLVDQVTELVVRADGDTGATVRDGLEELYGVLITGEQNAARSALPGPHGTGDSVAFSGFFSSRGGFSGSLRPPSSGDVTHGGPCGSFRAPSSGDQYATPQAEQRSSVAAASDSDTAVSAYRPRGDRSRSLSRGRRQRSGRKRRSQPSPG